MQPAHAPRRLRGPFFALLTALLVAPPPGLAAEGAIQPVATEAPAGDYVLDPAHARLIFSLSHLGFSDYTALFTGLSARLAFDPAAPERMRLEATVDASSIETHYPDPAFDFNALIAGPDFLDAGQFPEIGFTSSAVRLTAPDSAAVTGDLTLHGVTRPVTLRVRFNGGYAGHPLDPGGARIGFSAEGTIFRSDFGIGFGIPAPGTTLGVGDMVRIRIEAEFINPDAPGPQTGP
ncbi:MAG: polyisoprenoid-binding protein [Alphaproteobacteria bacterium HGW-Alphaproteobacteria-6]|nr:MAG: polyisoprenoid-binding protein [Alphaproteobacteria bacterium HGW-Alphaproteobacteria-6]